MTLKLIAVAVCALLQGTVIATAQIYPSKPITLIVPFGAGGPADTLARLLGERMKITLGQPIVIENVTGAAGSTGVGRLVRAAPDGYSIGIGHLGTHVFNSALYNLQYDLVNDLQPIALLPANTSVIVSKSDVPARTLTELVAWLKANPEQASAATAGLGSIAHIASIYFENKTGAAFRIVPYRSGAAAVGDVVAGHVTFMFDQLTGGSSEMYRSGKLRPFAVTAKTRLPAVPQIPTVDEAGLPGLYVSTWYGLWAPRGTPPTVIAILNAAVIEAIAEPEMRKRLDAQSATVPPREQQTPEALGAFQRAEIEKWWPIIKAANLKVE
jgi:tripartite-type tricarboxylate transporter receptor subunit TctC